MQSIEGLKAGEYQGAKKLKLSCGLTSFPKEILGLSETLEILDLSGNPLSSLPDEISQLKHLKIAFFSDCNFKTFPEQLAKCPALEMVAFKNNAMETIPETALPNLRWLILTNNVITSLPASIGSCHRLQKCMLAGNRLTSLPDSMANCKKLGLLRLSCNRLNSLPSWLFKLPELAFLAFAGNPCAPSFADNPSLDEISWLNLSVTKLLGEGASGVISQGIWKTEAEQKDVAVKLFKGEITSDGSPADEMNACITAGQHNNLISPLGSIKGHPDRRGLVLKLIPPHYTNLGLPPTLQTCTRDSFPPETVFSVEKCVSILTGIAAAAAHIHERGIAHGDLYAHNILIDDAGHALLGDFGAATIYGKDHGYDKDVEKLEVLAFGHLIEDMLSLAPRDVEGEGEVLSEKVGIVIEALNDLFQKCTTKSVEDRPLFTEICGILDGM
ncbi:outer arm dynein light chain 1 [Coleophoma cylindrospora]|uniref:Outer arm dynein light chain 1 n=1 Tax=Coleophoma cylindrospora TaxID=1849047 RepID=A0A3D8S985_9HELO|nr:outer arm dynein light chain 1 [Coleophoma cylindrospora]